VPVPSIIRTESAVGLTIPQEPKDFSFLVSAGISSDALNLMG
jgi:hypothetical protein